MLMINNNTNIDTIKPEFSNDKNVSIGLSLINPESIKDPGINVDSHYRFEKEENFDPTDIKWKFFGSPREIAVYTDGTVDILYGMEHAFGYIVSLSDSYMVFDICHGLVIERVYSDYDYDDTDDSLTE